MKRSGPLATFALMLAASAPGQDAPAPTVDQLQGAWKLESLSYDGVPQKAVGYMVFSGDHYAFVTTRERPQLTRAINRKELDELSFEERGTFVQAYRSMTAAAGPFSIEGSEILFMREAVRSPYLAGTAEHRRSWIDSGRLIQDFEGGGRRQVYVWQRAEQAPPSRSD